MTDELIDLRKSEAWGGRERSLQVFRCRVCGSLTNKIDSARYIGRYAICPNSNQNWHELFKHKLEAISDAELRLRNMRKDLEILRNLTPPAQDLSGEPDMSQIGQFSYRGDFIPEGKDRKDET